MKSVKILTLKNIFTEKKKHKNTRHKATVFPKLLEEKTPKIIAVNKMVIVKDASTVEHWDGARRQRGEIKQWFGESNQDRKVIINNEWGLD